MNIFEQTRFIPDAVLLKHWISCPR